MPGRVVLPVGGGVLENPLEALALVVGEADGEVVDARLRPGSLGCKIGIR